MRYRRTDVRFRRYVKCQLELSGFYTTPGLALTVYLEMLPPEGLGDPDPPPFLFVEDPEEAGVVGDKVARGVAFVQVRVRSRWRAGSDGFPGECVFRDERDDWPCESDRRRTEERQRGSARGGDRGWWWSIVGVSVL